MSAAKFTLKPARRAPSQQESLRGQAREHSQLGVAISAYADGADSRTDEERENLMIRIASVGGDETGKGEFPECCLVGVINSGAVSWFGSGVLVHKRVVLTAAHVRKDVNVVALWTNDADHLKRQEVRAVSRIPHKKFSVDKPGYDIALLIMAENDASAVTPAVLTTADEAASAAKIHAVGFGANNIQGDQGRNIQRVVDLDIQYKLGTTVSNDVQTKLGFDSSLEFVAGEKGYAMCHEDSGGPAYLAPRGSRKVLGLASREIKNSMNVCGDGTIFTRIDAHLLWIREKAAELGITIP